MGNTLPTADSVFGEGRASASVRSPTSYRAGMVEQASEAAGQGIENLGQGIQKVVAQKVGEQDQLNLVSAKSAFLRKITDIQNSFDNDQDFATMGSRYQEQAEQAKQDVMQSVTDPKQRILLSASLDDDAIRVGQGIHSQAKAKEIDHGKAFLDQSLDDNINSASTAKDEATRAALIMSGQAAIKASQERGYISADEAVAKNKKFVGDYAENWTKMQPPEKQVELLSPVTKGPVSSAAASVTSNSDDGLLMRFAHIESGGNPNAQNPNSSSGGLLQFTDQTAEKYGLKDKFDPEQSMIAGRKLLNDNRSSLEANLDRQPTDGELYLAHQQGAAGAAALIKNPDANAIDAISPLYKTKAQARNAILQNGGTATMTAGDFASKWTGKLENTPPQGEYSVQSTDQTQPYYAKTNTPVDFLSPDKKIALLNAAQSDIRQQQVLYRADLTTRVQDSNSMAMSGQVDPNPPTREDFYKAYGDKGENQYSEFLKTQQYAADVNTVQTVPDAQQNQLLDTLKPTPGPGFAAQNERYSKLQTAIVAVRKDRQEDPAAFAVRAKLLPNEALDVGNPSNLAKQIANQGSVIQSMQGDYGTPLLPLNKSQVIQLTQTLNNMPATERAVYMGSLYQAIPSNEVYQGVLKQISNASYVTALAGAFMAKQGSTGYNNVASGTVASDLLTGEDLIRPPPIDGKEVQPKFKIPEDKKMLADFYAQTNGSFTNRLAQSGQALQAVQAYYAALSNKAGDNSGVYAPDRMTTAIKTVLGDMPDVNGNGKIITPWGVPTNQFIDSAESQFNQAIKDTNRNPENFNFSHYGLINTETPNQFLVTTGGSYLSDADGRPMRITVNGNEAPYTPYRFADMARDLMVHARAASGVTEKPRINPPAEGPQVPIGNQ